METTIFSEVQSIDINSKKSVLVRGWEKDDVEIRYPGNKECGIDFDDNHLSINAKSYIILSVPTKTEIVFERIYGNLETVGPLGKILVENVSGNCSIQSAESLVIENVSGNCKIGQISSNANIGNVGGNLHFVVENGVMSIKGVGGNLTGKADSINLSTSVGGNIKLITNHFVGKDNQLRAGGSIKLNLVDYSDLLINAKAGGVSSIITNENPEKFTNGRFEKTFGSGSMVVKLRAGGNIKVSDQEPDYETSQNFGSADDDYINEITDKFESRSMQSSGFDFSDLFDIESEVGERIREKTLRADEKIQEKIQAAMEKMERKFSFKEEFGNLPRPPRPPRTVHTPSDEQQKSQKTSSISQEERMMILKMLQEKKITAEDADRLLRALDQF